MKMTFPFGGDLSPDGESGVGMGPFEGLRVIDVSPNRVGAQVSQLFADFGADVIQVESAGGAVIRHHAAYPFWARGKRSLVLNKADEADREIFRNLAATADVLIETQHPGAMDALGLGYAELSKLNPRLVYTSITGFGRHGPYADAPGYQGLVHAKLGAFRTFRRMSPFPEPPFVNVPFASFAASQVAIHGILSALYERESSGLGQWVETNLLQAFTTLDTWAWFEHLIADRWPDAFTKSDPYDDQGRPASPLTFMLLVCLTKDGHWLQFAAVAPHLFAAHMKSLGLAWMFTDDNWKGLPLFDGNAGKRMELWTKMLEASREKTLAEWQDVFDADPNVFAEQFRHGPGALDHPQLAHDGFVVEINDIERGVVRQPAAIVKAASTPADLTRSAPTLDQHRAEILALAAAASGSASASDSPAVAGGSGLPLAGVTILELATLFAGPHGTTMLTDLGATVIKVEPLIGDMIRRILPFPESGGFKVMQGKESIAVDLATDEGRALVQQLASTADVVIQGYRAGAMTKLGLDYAAVRKSNPNVIYVNAPGYGVDGPYGKKPAYAPSIGAASGIPFANVGVTVAESADLTMDEIKDGARRLSAASAMANAQADGFAALGVASAILFGLVARARGAGGQELFSSMLNTGGHAMSAQCVTYPGAPHEPAPGADLRGLGSLYRVYDAADGTYVFLAAPAEADFARLAMALSPYVDLRAKHSDPAVRARHPKALITELAALFVTKSAQAWEDELLPQGVGCMAVNNTSIEDFLFDPAYGRASGYVADVVHPTLDKHPRLAPYIRYSRSATQALPAVLAGEQTDLILGRLGMSEEAIADLRARDIVA
jgi:crotonobetainyl-CoA:carnitine CoA-transferase CaiB-like acyl-CoA transferase